MNDSIENASIGIIGGINGGIELIPIVVEHVGSPVTEEEIKRCRRHDRIGDITLYVITGICFVAIGALIGLLTMVL